MKEVVDGSGILRLVKASRVPSPCCGEELSIIGSRERKLAGEGGERRLLVIRRLRCTQCRKIPSRDARGSLFFTQLQDGCAESQRTVFGPSVSRHLRSLSQNKNHQSTAQWERIKIG